MSEFYKLLFAPFQKQWVDQKKKASVPQLLHSFALINFEVIYSKLNSDNQGEFVKMLMAVVHSHRHNKDDEEQNVDFTVVRETMYKYSKQAQKRFFERPALSFLFAWFALNADAARFIESKYSDKGQDYLQRIFAEMGELKQQALETLNLQAQAMPQRALSPMLSRYIEVACKC